MLRTLFGSTTLPDPVSDLEGWWARHVEVGLTMPRAIDRAMLGGAAMDRLGYAFASGYQAALRAMIPELPRHAAASLAATEAGGVHPRAMETTLRTLEDGRRVVRGQKTFATLVPFARELLVVMNTGVVADGRPRLRLARLQTGRPGVQIQAAPATSFAPEIPHAVVQLDDVALETQDLFEGDAWDHYLKPFRTIEDIHVLAAVLAHFSRFAVALAWPEATVERLVSLLPALHALAGAAPGDPGTHVGLAGVVGEVGALLPEIDRLMEAAPEPFRGRHRRDRPLLNVAAAAREERRKAAWRALRAGSEATHRG